MKNKKPVLISISLSVVLHAMFFPLTLIIEVPGVRTMVSRTTRFFNLKSIKRELLIEKPLRKRGTTYAQTLKFRSPDYSGGAANFVSEDDYIEKTKMEIDIKPISPPALVSPVKDMDKKIKKDKTIDKLFEKDRRRRTRKELIGATKFTGDDGIVRPGEVIEIAELPEDFYEKMPGFTPKVTGVGLEGIKDRIVSTFAKENISVIRRKTDMSDLQEYLICELSVYQDPKGNDRYYRIGIRAGKDASELQKVPKEIIFLVDCSLSIQRERLEQFKKGIRYCLVNLNDGDVFNIIAFKHKLEWYKPKSVIPTSRNIKDALEFVSNLTAGQVTDTYNALYESIKAGGQIIPSYIVLFSDGRPSYGITDSREIINKISRLNKGERPIFAFSGGLRVNRYFLDFISYKNRGWTEYASRTHRIGRHIARMYEKIKDPILLNLRYRVSGLDIDEIFPKTLPDFYRNAEFTLYGKYTDEDNEFSLQLLGEIEDQTNEFIVVGDFKNASRGGGEIARNWAFNKIYYLIGLLEYNRGNKKILGEINALCKRYKIKTPYSEGIKR